MLPPLLFSGICRAAWAAPAACKALARAAGRYAGCLRALDGSKKLGLGLAEIEPAGLAGLPVCVAILLRAPPFLERIPVLPDAVRGIEGVLILCCTTEKVEADESRHVAKPALAIAPDILELLLPALHDLEAVHREKHSGLLVIAKHCAGRSHVSAQASGAGPISASALNP